MSLLRRFFAEKGRPNMFFFDIDVFVTMKIFRIDFNQSFHCYLAITESDGPLPPSFEWHGTFSPHLPTAIALGTRSPDFACKSLQCARLQGVSLLLVFGKIRPFCL